jgi:leucine dehydrogenase
VEPEKILRARDAASGLDAVIVLHSLRFGPCFGGIRVFPYASDEEMVEDAQRLAEAMTYKAIANDIAGGGAKCAVNESSLKDRRAAMRRLGAAVQSLEGKFWTGSDLGLTADDVAALTEQTIYAHCADLSDAAAAGVLHAIRAAAGSPEGLKVAVQGMGSVGAKVARTLRDRGARVVVTDVRREAARGFDSVSPEEIYAVPCDVFSPCALGGVLNARTVPRLRCASVCGAANNPLAEREDAARLHRRGIVYVPDFIANAGALIQGARTTLHGDGDYSAEVAKIYDRVRSLIEAARRENLPPDLLARRAVEARLAAAAQDSRH